VADQTWLQLDDQLLLDDTDYRVVAVLVGRTDRLTFRRLSLLSQLRGEPRTLLQLEGALMEAEDLPPEALAGERVELQGRTFRLRWDSEVRTERTAADASANFGRGRCAWYAADDGSVAVLLVERYDRDAFMGAPIAPSRIDLRFTEGLRRGGRD
jgi:hypothetical protein